MERSPSSAPYQQIVLQLGKVLMHMQSALDKNDWATLQALDMKLQQALPRLQAHTSHPDVKEKLIHLNRFYTVMLDKASQEKASIQQKISQQSAQKHGLLSYIQHQ